MLGLVLAADVVLLYLFWELTTVRSFLPVAGRAAQDRVTGLSAASHQVDVRGLGGFRRGGRGRPRPAPRCTP